MRLIIGTITVICTGLSGCTADWTLPSGYILTCTFDSDCPGNQTCNTQTSSCVDPSQPVCGNGQVEYGEDCDIGNEATQHCAYGDKECVVCIGLDIESLEDKAIDELVSCQYRRIKGAWCGDGVVQQRGLQGGVNLFHEEDNGIDTGEWEVCDSEEPVSCASLHEGLGSGMATCVTKNHENIPPDASLNCMVYDTSQCENQEMAFVPAGPFMMGCNAPLDSDCQEDEHDSELSVEGPYHEVFLDGFLIDILEVSAGEYQQCVETGACVYEVTTPGEHRTYNNNRDDHPINFVDWQAAQTYCEAQENGCPQKQSGRKRRGEPTADCTHGAGRHQAVSVPSCRATMR